MFVSTKILPINILGVLAFYIAKILLSVRRKWQKFDTPYKVSLIQKPQLTYTAELIFKL